MTWVRLTCEQEAIVEVDLPITASKSELRDAALVKLDESGGSEWETILADTEAATEPIPYYADRPS